MRLALGYLISLAVPPLWTVELFQLLPFSVSASLLTTFSAQSRYFQFSKSSQESFCLIPVLMFDYLFSLSINQNSNNYTHPYQEQQNGETDQNLFQFAQLYSMSKAPLEDLSAIMQKKQCQESQLTFQQSKPIYNIRCLQNNRENYQCIICNRLRQVCPYTKLTQCLHEGRQRGVYKSDFFMEKSNMSTLVGERMRTMSNHEAFKQTQQSRQERTLHNFAHEYRQTAIPQNQTQISISPASQIIYYPVIHNKFVVSPAVDKSTGVTGTPKRMGKSRRVDYDDEVILTPTQIKEMLNSYKQ